MAHGPHRRVQVHVDQVATAGVRQGKGDGGVVAVVVDRSVLGLPVDFHILNVFTPVVGGRDLQLELAVLHYQRGALI